MESLRSACVTIEWPDDELSVYATLHGALFAIPDHALLRYRREVGRLHPLRPPEKPVSDELQPVSEALKTMAELHRGRNHRPIADTLNRLLDSTRAHAAFAFRPGGNQALGNVYRVVDLARSFETGGGISFRSFVEELNSRAERADSGEAPMIEEAAEGVRLMTVHTAKGLEFPVVILADMTANIQQRNPDRYIDSDRRLCATRVLWCAPQELIEHESVERARDYAEGIRVAYVAATRARDLLVVPTVGTEERDGWLQPLNKAIYPAARQHRSSRFAPACPKFGEFTVMDLDPGAENSVRPGLHKPQTGEHHVVWWDPEKLRLNVEERFGIPGHQMLKGDLEPSLKPYETWLADRQSRIERGEHPSLDLFTPSETSEAPYAAAEVAFEAAPRAPGRPTGARFGSLVHAVLREALADPRIVREIAEAHARIVRATTEQVEAAVEAVEAALRHPLLARAQAAERIYRELPVFYRFDDGRALEGVVDLAFLEDGVWNIIDFKTDADLASRRAHYRSQLQWYALALSRLTGQPARCTVFGV